MPELTLFPLFLFFFFSLPSNCGFLVLFCFLFPFLFSFRFPFLSLLLSSFSFSSFCLFFPRAQVACHRVGLLVNGTERTIHVTDLWHEYIWQHKSFHIIYLCVSLSYSGLRLRTHDSREVVYSQEREWTGKMEKENRKLITLKPMHGVSSLIVGVGDIPTPTPFFLNPWEHCFARVNQGTYYSAN